MPTKKAHRKKIAPSQPPHNPDAQLAQIPEDVFLQTRPFMLLMPITLLGDEWSNLRKLCLIEQKPAAQIIEEILHQAGVGKKLKTWAEARTSDCLEELVYSGLNSKSIPSGKSELLQAEWERRREPAG